MTRVESEIELFYNEKATGAQIRSRLDYIEVGENNLNISSTQRNRVKVENP